MGVEIVDISITDVGLPSSIAQQMTARTMVRSKQAYEVMEQKFAMLEIKCENEVEQLKLQNDEKESKQKAVGAKEVQDLKEDLAIKRAKHRRQLSSSTSTPLPNAIRSRLIPKNKLILW